MNSVFKNRRGFTLIELLLVIGIIAILASIVIVAVNPSKQLGSARNAQRRADINAILNAIYQYSIDHNGNMPTAQINATTKEICRDKNTNWKTGGVCGYDVAGVAPNNYGVNLYMLTGTYIVKMPTDPTCATQTGTGSCYVISKDSTGRITVTASGVEVNGTLYKYNDGSTGQTNKISISR